MSNTLLPYGVSDYLPEGYLKKTALESALKTVFSAFGALPVEPPALDFAENFIFAPGSREYGRMFKFADTDGSLLALRPDPTMQIARIAASQCKAGGPLKFFYSLNSYENSRRRAGARPREFAQIGLEYFNAAGAEADAEIVRVAADALAAAGIQNFRIELGGETPAYLEKLVSLLPAPVKARVEIDPEIARAGYYTGVVFNALAPNCGAPLLEGGRYDDLAARYGKAMPAVGFAIGTARVLESLSRPAAGGGALRIALPKGRLMKEGVKILSACGVDCSGVADDGRVLTAETPDKKIKFIFVKPADAPIYIERGAADIGIAGKDVLLEEGCDVKEVLPLPFGKCRICVAGYAGTDFTGINNLRAATKYPAVAERYFAEKGISADIIKLNGSIELAPVLGMADVIVDIVESGSTLKANGLVVLDEVAPVSAVLIANKVSFKLKRAMIAPLAKKINLLGNEARNF
ncbi:MAG: ATP phosphoribosyltransferase [Clostridiales bacterium]|jgi:ATP phosphoribosyltransferase|nr:ATP phosphoribosyltransferase [Clostridiales bacterium]